MKRFYFSKVIVLLMFLGFGSVAAYAQCNCAAKYYMPIAVKNLGSSTLTNYQVSITVNTAALVSAGKMQATGNDIRFQDGSCTNMPYWIESGMNTSATVIWIKVASIPASGTATINMYYGDATATAASNGDNTFILFDDFNGSSLDATKWTFAQSGGSVTISGGLCSITNSGYGLVESVNSYAGPYYSECKVNSFSGSYPSMAQADNGNYNSGATMFLSGSTLYFYATSGSPGYGSSLSNGNSLGSGVGIWSVCRTNSSGFLCKWPAGSYTYTGTNANSSSNQSSAFGDLNGSSSTMVVDWFRARKYDAAGTSQTIGAELGNGAGPISGLSTICGNDTTTFTDGTAGGGWTSQYPAVASIDPVTGLVTGLSAGTSTITYTVGSCTPAYKVITVKQAPGTTIFNFSSVICSGTTLNLSNSVSGGTWTSSDAGVAAVDANLGTLTTPASGVANISYTMASGCYVTRSLLVNLAPKAIAGPNFLCTGITYALSDAVAGGVWTSSNASASVNSTSGAVTAVATGTPFITYKIPAGGCYAIYPVTVNVQPAPITGNTAICLGSSISMNDASPAGTWTSSNPYQASVTPGAGFVTGVATGNPTITYMLSGGCFSTVTATVNPVPNTVLMSPAPKVCMGSLVNVTTAETGGAWSSSNTSIATVVAATGDVTGVAAGTADIRYTFTATGCSSAITATVNSLPTAFAVGGGGGYCQGGLGTHVTLQNSELDVNYDLYDGSGLLGTQVGSAASLDFGAFAPAATTTYTVQATDKSGCKKDMIGSAVITINPLPVAFDLTFPGLSAYCAGGTGVHLQLDSSQSGVNYRANNAGVLSPVVPGTGTGKLDLGLYTAGTYFIEATNAVTGCKNTMNNIKTVTAISLPGVYPVISTSPSTAYCAGGAGVDVSLPNSETGVTYSLFRNGVFVTAVTSVSSGTALPFGGNQKTAGNYTVIAVDSSAGCASNMSGSVTVVVNPLPIAQTVSGGGAYCIGTGGKHINLINSIGGVKYILKDGFGNSVDSAIGSNSGLDFGAKTVGGTYTVIAVDALGCQNNMTGNAVISVNGLPNVYSVIGGGPYCSGDTAKHIKLFGFDLGVKYQLFKDGVSVGTAKTGIGTGVDFGQNNAPGAYTVVAINPATTCTNNMANPVSVAINPLPGVHTVLGGGSFCAGDPNGVCITLIPGDAGIDYTLYANGISQSTQTGNDDTLKFCNITLPGTYTIIGSNSLTGCPRNMTGSTIVKVNALPVNYKVTGGGQFCAGGPGLPIGDSLSASGIEYTLLESGNPVGPVLGGTGKALNFGLFGQGSYTIRAKNLVTGCTNTGSSTGIIMNPLPVVHNVSGSATICAGDSRNITLDMSDTTDSYQLYNGKAMVGSAMAGVNGVLDFGAKTAAGKYTVVAMDTASHCTNAMNDTAILNVIPVPSNFAVTISDTSRCAFDVPGLRMDLGGSELNTMYTVYTGVTTDSFFAGTGLPIFLGYHKNAGYYKVVAVNTNGCTTTMNDSVKITIRSTNATSDSIYVVGGDSTVCSGRPVTLKSIPTNPGSAPIYVWKVNGSAAGTDSMLTYIPSSGDVVTAIMKSNADCAFPSSATSKPLALDVQLSAISVATVTASAVSPVCPGTKITFTASASFPGTTPHYAWIMNGNPVGADAASYSVVPTDSMVVFVQFMSDYKCRVKDYVLSNDIPFALNEPVLPILSISALTPTYVNKGEAVTLKAVVENRGKTAFTYQWYVHGVLQTGETTPTFTHNYFVDNEDVKVVVNSHNICGDLSTSQSTLIRVRDNTGVKNVSTGGDVRVLPNPSKGTFSVKGNLGNTADEEVTLELTNMLGQVVYSSKAMSHSGNIDQQVQLTNTIASGMYILNLRSDSDHEVFHVVIEQ